MRCLKKCLIALCCVTGLSAMGERPNIVWIEADDLMPRFMNKLGGGFGLTPNLDRLAREGVHFPNAVAQAPMCGPSRNCLLTNLYPHNLGFYRNGHARCLPENIWTFPPVLRDAGYQTAYIGKSHIRPPAEKPKATKDEVLEHYGFDWVRCTGERYILWKFLKEGWSVDDNPYVQHLKEKGLYEQWVDYKTGWPFKKSTMADDGDYLDGFTTQVAVDWLNEERDESKPFFLWFNFCLPHDPYDVPQRWYDRVAHIDIPPPKTKLFGHDVPEPLLKDAWTFKDDAEVQEHRRGEVANVAFMDAMVGKLLDALEAAGELENTVVIFFSDHSIFLGNHGLKGKGTLFEEALSTSMIVSWPKKFPKDQINPQPMELLDLVPTTFEVAGVENPNDVALNGVSVLPLLNGKSNGKAYAFSEILGAQAATDERYRYIVSEGVELLYDHETDPYEMKNVASEFPEITERMRKAVEHWLETTGPVHPPKTY